MCDWLFQNVFFFLQELPVACFFCPQICPWLSPKPITNKKNPGRFAGGQKITIPLNSLTAIGGREAVILLRRYWCAKVHRRRFLFTANYFFVVPEHTPILFFYPWTFPPKIIDFVTQIAKLHYKVTRILKNPQIEYQNPQVKNLGSWKSVICICGLFSTDSRQHLPTSARCCQIQPTRNVCQLANLPFLHFI